MSTKKSQWMDQFVDKFAFKHDSELQRKWSGKRVVRTELDPYLDPGIDFTDSPSRTDASQAESCDVNHILKTFNKTGVLPGVNVESVFADVSDSRTYQEALDLVISAQDQFMSLDAHVRKKFSNDPAEFLAFASDPKNAKELVSMGLATLTAPDPADRIVEAIRSSNGDSTPPSPASPPPAAGSRTRSDK